jgi:hypothetical protein
MRGKQCSSIHLCPLQQKASEKSRKIRAWMLQEIPEMALGKWKRVNSFLN